jgi:hypothetical protein
MRNAKKIIQKATLLKMSFNFQSTDLNWHNKNTLKFNETTDRSVSH